MHSMMTIFGDGGGGVSGLMKKKKDFLKNMEYTKITLQNTSASCRMHLTRPYDDIILI